jgi:hypothetical protein
MNVGGLLWGNTFGSGPANHTAQRHELMKAVLLNSADKLAGVHGSTRTIEGTLGRTWANSPAATNEDIPLDLQFGAGHLNAQRALTQFESGEQEPFTNVPLIGWDFGETGGPITILQYPLAEPLVAGEYISATLVWDRFVNKTGSATSFSPGDIFSGAGLNDLDLFILEEGWVDYAAEAIPLLYSNSKTDNVEHVFAQIPTSGNYEIVVVHAPGGLETDQHFALAWWYGNPYSTTTPGDLNGDGAVNGRDFLAWQRGESPNPLSAGDLADWQNNYGNGALAATTAVPEPYGLGLLFGLTILGRRRR